MREIGARLQQRAKELGLTDVAIARRLGLTQTRYSNYTSGIREPDLRLFARICRELETTPNEVLGFGGTADASAATTRSRIEALVQGFERDRLELALSLMQAVARHGHDRVPRGDPDADDTDGPALD